MPAPCISCNWLHHPWPPAGGSTKGKALISVSDKTGLEALAKVGWGTRVKQRGLPPHAGWTCCGCSSPRAAGWRLQSHAGLPLAAALSGGEERGERVGCQAGSHAGKQAGCALRPSAGWTPVSRPPCWQGGPPPPHTHSGPQGLAELCCEAVADPATYHTSPAAPPPLSCTADCRASWSWALMWSPPVAPQPRWRRQGCRCSAWRRSLAFPRCWTAA